jgi:hypothetical protein
MAAPPYRFNFERSGRITKSMANFYRKNVFLERRTLYHRLTSAHQLPGDEWVMEGTVAQTGHAAETVHSGRKLIMYGKKYKRQ